jgi:hypothetical protein
MIYFLYLRWLFLLSVFAPSKNQEVRHEIHVSKCEIQHNAQTSTLEIATQIFLDDLQTQLATLGAPDLHLCTEKETKVANQELMKYLGQKLKITVDGKTLEGAFIGKELSEDMLAVWTYIEYKMPTNFNKINVKYDVLMDLYDDQKNIVNLKIKGKNGYLLFNKKHVEESINY